MNKTSIRGNDGNLYEVYVGFSIGDKVTCIKSMEGMCDDGNINILFKGSLLTKDKDYIVSYISNWGGQQVSWVENDDGAFTWVTTEHFKLIE
jgi:hypothetical protein